MEKFLTSWYKKDCSKLPSDQLKLCKSNITLADKIWAEIDEVKKEAENCEKFLNRDGTWETRVRAYQTCAGRVNSKYEDIASKYDSEVKQNLA